MRELRCKLFKGIDDEDAHKHVRMVLEIADLFHFPGVTHDAIMVRVFPITLNGPALRWINRLSTRSITTWDLLEKAFIRQYCPPFKTAKKLEEIRNFKQEWMSHCIGSSDDTTQALNQYKSWQHHSRNWYDKATTRERIDSSSDNVDIKKLDENIHVFQVADDEWIRKFIENTDSNIRALKTTTKNLQNDMKELVPRDLPVYYPYVQPTPVPERLKRQKASVARGGEHDIPLQDGIMQPLTPQTTHIIPPDDVAPATSPILDKHSNKFREEFFDITRVAEMADGNPVKDLSAIIKTYDYKTFIHKLLHKFSQLEIGIRALLDSFSCGKMVSAWS
ncbi:calmodulin-interacting protein 111 isoform X1 [Tanacetum coccineum]